MKNRAFWSKTGKSIFCEISLFFLGSCHDKIDLGYWYDWHLCKKKICDFEHRLGVKVVKLLREALTFQRAILKIVTSKIKSWKTFSYFENTLFFVFFSPRFFWQLLSCCPEKIKTSRLLDPKRNWNLIET